MYVPWNKEYIVTKRVVFGWGIIKMRKQLVLVSIIIFIVTFLIMKFFMEGKVSGMVGTNFLIAGVGVSVLLAIFSEKGRVKTIVLSFYSLLIVGFIMMVILYRVAHM